MHILTFFYWFAHLSWMDWHLSIHHGWNKLMHGWMSFTIQKSQLFIHAWMTYVIVTFGNHLIAMDGMLQNASKATHCQPFCPTSKWKQRTHWEMGEAIVCPHTNLRWIKFEYKLNFKTTINLINYVSNLFLIQYKILWNVIQYHIIIHELPLA
jgi:hypothetical protein